MISEEVNRIVDVQVETGIDIVNDGEASKSSYVTYITDRLTGFLGSDEEIQVDDLDATPRYRDQVYRSVRTKGTWPRCVSRIAYVGRAQVDRDVKNLLNACSKVGQSAAFMTAPSPGTIALFFGDGFYLDYESYVCAIGDAMKAEYDAIHAAGLLLQLDCPDLAMGGHVRRKALPADSFFERSLLNVAALNSAVRDIPPDRMRIHVCWGNYEGPHDFDKPLRDLIEVLGSTRPAGLMIEGANPRHEHEWKLMKDARLNDRLIYAGVIDTTTNFIEHPELVAERISRVARLVGADRVVASTDCGFSSFAGHPLVHPDIAWKKLRMLVEGAKLASSLI